MIGTKIKGFRHLIRMARTLSEVQFFFKHDFFRIDCGIALYVKADEQRNPYMSAGGDYLMIFNNSVSNVRYDDMYHKSEGVGKRIKELRAKYPSVWVTPVERRNFQDDSHMMAQILAVPSDFETKYSEFCEANKKQMPNATRFTDINSPILKYFFAITSGSKNFFFWAVNAFFKQGINVYLLEKIMIWNDGYSQLSSKLNKGTITGYTNGHDFFTLVREMTKLRRAKRANDVINMFNTAQKKALKGYSLKARDYDTLSKFGKLSGKKKNNFIRKMSTIENPAEILKQMSFLADIHFEWKKESLLEFIKNADGFKCEVVMDKGDMVLLKVEDYETVKRLAKTTNWCISKDKKYWNEYVENNPNATQYVLMDFSRKEDDNLSIVGFTSVHDRGITNAHDFQNRNLMQGRRTNTVSEIKSFVAKYIDCSSIYGVLDKYGIKLSDVVSYEPNQYKWDRDSMFDYLNQCVDEDDYYIIYDDGDKVALIVENDNVRYFLGDAYIDQRGHRGEFGNQHIIFADFTKKANDPEKLVFGIITHNFEEHESSCARLFNDRFETINQSFDSKLEEYGLPYDIICRKDNVVERFYNALSSLELATAKDLIKDKKVKDSLLSQDRANFVRDSITNVTFGYNSTDYINLFYDANYNMSDIIGVRNAGDLARRMINNMHDTAANMGKCAYVPTAEDIKSLYDGNTGDYNKAFYTGNFLMLMKMLDKETSRDFVYRVVNTVHERHNVCDLFDLIMTRAIDMIDIAHDYDVAKFIVSYAFNLGSPRVINAISSKKNIDERLNQFIATFKKREVKTTEMWVRNNDGVYIVEGINEEAIAHAPRRR
jgi:hypothetical protein